LVANLPMLPCLAFYCAEKPKGGDSWQGDIISLSVLAVERLAFGVSTAIGVRSTMEVRAWLCLCGATGVRSTMEVRAWLCAV
jgi:hypothetical protein